MKNKKIFVTLAVMLVLLPQSCFAETNWFAIKTSAWYQTLFNFTKIVEAETAPVKLSHRQELWMNVLEWCESRGDPDAVNEKDLDGTASYGAFQFKPSTLNYYAEKYSVATTTVMDYDVQKAVVTQMILHRNEIKWTQQFPDCVKKFGLPPIK